MPDTQLSLPRKWTAQVQHKFLNPQQPLLANDKVRHVGEAVAVIVAESRYPAEDAAELVTVELEPLPAVVDPEAALRPGAPVIHDSFDTNLIGVFRIGKGDVEGALARAPHRLQAALSPSPLRRDADGVPRRRGTLRRARRFDHDLVIDARSCIGCGARPPRCSDCPRRACAASRPTSAAVSASRATSIPRIC